MWVPEAAHKVDTDDKLRLRAALARYLRHHARGSVVCRGRAMRGRSARLWRTVTLGLAVLVLPRRPCWGIPRRASMRRVASGLLLGRISRRARVDGR
jgi:hypothetical protein